MNYTSPQQIAQALEPVLQDKALCAQLAAQAKPAVWFQTYLADGEPGIALGRSKFGGLPDLPVGYPWPQRSAYPDVAQRGKYPRASERAHAWRLGAEFPLNFLAQINFAEVWAAGPLDEDFPRSGLLSVFYDLTEKPWGDDPSDALGLQVLYHDEPGTTLQRLPLPDALQALPAHWHLTELACEPHACWTPLSFATVQWRKIAHTLSRDQQDSYADWRFDENGNAASADGADWCCHHLGGWPNPIQSEMQTQCALVDAGISCSNGDAFRDAQTKVVRDTADQWVLLLQIGTDDKGLLHWGDDGQVYLWIRREDLRARCFERTRLVLQCY